ncbi:RNA-guided endonuclease TnpB family protein [Natronorubrum thiooxidans]|uniref:Transposase, IS605 OrfB family, central region n=1 Tax=Natronorubrum thiooxidans TaxID=308853 RepID=A0A1N7GCG1_9EURY|nr:RNA-guided endonuclease TnpB family protein [Natronorubrum thiooxidans]SIS10244.1 transposase, IS605 OrfB family, central region [Natronorubrum thiooxidans]
MTTTATKTLEATLAPPTTGKEQRLERTVATYRRALSDAFESGADTQTAVNDIVTGYTLTSYAKDALKNYVPQLRRTYNASELEDNHPVRFTNRGFRIDHSDERTHEFCWRVPQAGRGNAFWIPLRINPEQESLWFDLLDGDISVGEFRLQQYRTSWVLHVTVEYEVADPEIPDDPTRIGFDIGESKLLTGCACQNDTPTRPYIYDGGRARALRKEMHTTLKRLQKRDAEQWRVDERFDHYQNALTDIVEKASREAVEYAESFDNPVIVLENLSYIRENLDYGKYMNRRLHSWAFARVTDRIEDKALEAGIPVEFVNPRYTSQTCHACGHIGHRGSQAEFKCTNAECWVTEYQADINAAANIAGRVDPWGESVPWKPERDDSPRNGSRCDTATGHRTPSRQSRQTTLAVFET